MNRISRKIVGVADNGDYILGRSKEGKGYRSREEAEGSDVHLEERAEARGGVSGEGPRTETIALTPGFD